MNKEDRLTSLYKTDHPPNHAKLNLILKNDYIREKEVNDRNGFQGFSFSKANWDKINQYNNENPFNQYCYSNVDLMTELRYTWLLNIIEKHIPRKTKHRSSLAPWVTSETSKLIKIMDTMRRKWEKNVTECQLDKLKTFEKHLKLNLSEDQRVYEENLFVDGNFSKLQKNFESIRKTDTIPGEFYLDDQRTTSNTDEANLFNKYFQSVFSHSLYIGEINPSHENKIANFHFTATEIEKLLENLDINKGKGPDNLGNILLEKLSCSISKSLYLISNTIANKCVFPSTWKKAK